ncbi:MAG: hypothetical protein MZW92_20940 [Comamonadaceae bacterium]|nr:hypothetical protein [Comamonadaceae bacterium]
MRESRLARRRARRARRAGVHRRHRRERRATARGRRRRAGVHRTEDRRRRQPRRRVPTPPRRCTPPTARSNCGSSRPTRAASPPTPPSACSRRPEHRGHRDEEPEPARRSAGDEGTRPGGRRGAALRQPAARDGRPGRLGRAVADLAGAGLTRTGRCTWRRSRRMAGAAGAARAAWPRCAPGARSLRPAPSRADGDDLRFAAPAWRPWPCAPVVHALPRRRALVARCHRPARHDARTTAR